MSLLSWLGAGATSMPHASVNFKYNWVQAKPSGICTSLWAFIAANNATYLGQGFKVDDDAVLEGKWVFGGGWTWHSWSTLSIISCSFLCFRQAAHALCFLPLAAHSLHLLPLHCQDVSSADPTLSNCINDALSVLCLGACKQARTPCHPS